MSAIEQVPERSYLTGVGTHQISWGIPAGGTYQSAYRFEGVTTTTATLGSDFLIGTFIHFNFPVINQ